MKHLDLTVEEIIDSLIYENDEFSEKHNLLHLNQSDREVYLKTNFTESQIREEFDILVQEGAKKIAENQKGTSFAKNI